MLVLELSVTLELNTVSFVIFLSASAQNSANTSVELKSNGPILNRKGFLSSLTCSS